MTAVAEDGLTVVLSYHVIADLERVSDYLVILSSAHVQVAGDTEAILARHKLLTGPRTNAAAIARVHAVVQERHTERQTRLLVRSNGHNFDPVWTISDVQLEDVVLAYLRAPAAHALPEPVLMPSREEAL